MTSHIFLSAGEASGDLHASHLAQALRSLAPGIRVSCLGGYFLRRSGAEVVVDNREIGVVGLFEVFRHLRSIWEAWGRIRAHLAATRPRVVVLVDFPDFNFMLARLAKRLGLRVFYYISPQIWGWRPGRVRTVKRLVDEMAVILPFEKDFYRAYGMEAHYVGHPLLDVLARAPSREESIRRYCDGGPPEKHHPKDEALSRKTIGLLPGSRRGEIAFLLPLLLDAAGTLLRHDPTLSFLLPVAPGLDRGLVERHLEGQNVPVQVISGDTYGVIQACHLILTASGTVTLEAAILGTPMVIVYKVSSLSYYTGRHLIRVSHVGLPNLIAGEGIVPELLQEEARPDRVAAEALRFLRRPEELEAQRRALSRIRERLGEPGVAERVAHLVLRAAQ